MPDWLNNILENKAIFKYGIEWGLVTALLWAGNGKCAPNNIFHHPQISPYTKYFQILPLLTNGWFTYSQRLPEVRSIKIIPQTIFPLSYSSSININTDEYNQNDSRSRRYAL